MYRKWTTEMKGDTTHKISDFFKTNYHIRAFLESFFFLFLDILRFCNLKNSMNGMIKKMFWIQFQIFSNCFKMHFNLKLQSAECSKESPIKKNNFFEKLFFGRLSPLYFKWSFKLSHLKYVQFFSQLSNWPKFVPGLQCSKIRKIVEIKYVCMITSKDKINI